MFAVSFTNKFPSFGTKFSQLRSLSKTQFVASIAPQFSAYDTNTYTIDKINPSEEKFNKVLIANRGEIACRVMKTCKAMGIKTVAVHSDVDSNALHVLMADEAVCVGPAPTSESYLRADKILEAVKQTGAEAVHPGYGFLSENTHFAAQLAENGVKFIGPNSKAILDMGDKIHSKKIATNAKVNMIPGYDGEIVDEKHCVEIANKIGYPVMIKASAGGGGKGMRVAWNDKECVSGYRLSKQEAKSSFGDDRMLVEKFIDNPRHIEVQLLCDKHGNAIYLNERECSIQRRNQKVIEEAPSSFVDPDMRKRMGEQAVQLAKAVGYDSAGTVEFLVDSQKNFYFLEMNTRLQVEHPISEQITHIDIVQQMLRVAYGHKLNIKQSDVGIHGWAFESRVYAEDPYKGFGLPSVGRLTKYEEPSSKIQGIRCDSGIREGSEISIYYDPLICKLVSYGKDRNEALDRMREALDNYVIRGLTHNISLHRDIIDEENFRKGNITTKYLEQTYPEGFKGTQLNKKEELHLAALSGVLYAKKDARAQQFTNYKVLKNPFMKTYRYIIQHGEKGEENFKQFEVVIDFVNGDANKAVSKVNGEVVDISGNTDLSQSVLRLKVGDEMISTQIHSKKPGNICLIYKGSPFKMNIYPTVVSEYLQHIKERPKLDLSSVVLAPMPGAIKNVKVKAGDMVVEGQELVVIEAMKMQNSLLAGKTGKVKSVNCKVGSTVDEGETLVVLE
uniref:Propionyl-CoA carboxylase alpha chain, mitochondrial n=1 Tax=Strongyloides stercoralis TaxID=6248 RepID=A0A0K0ER14_STRER